MKFKKLIILSMSFVGLLAGCKPGTDSTNPPGNNVTTYMGEYLGQSPPGNTPDQFLPEIITEQVHSTTVFSPDGNEVYWSPMDGTGMRFMEQVDGIWTNPEIAYFGGSDDAGEPFFSQDGNRLYFTSWRPPNVAGILQKENIWYVERTDLGWGDPVILNNIVNEIDLHWSFSIADNGNLYYGGHPIGEEDQNDIHVAEYENGSYVSRTRLSENINTGNTEDTPFIAPDESYLMFARVGPGSNYADLYICFKNNDGSWADPINMESINTGGHELCPIVTRDGRFLFFMSTRSGESKPYWVSADVIDEYR